MWVVKDYTLSLTLPLQRFVRSVLQLKGQKVRSPDYGQSNNSKGEGKNKNTTTALNEKQPTQKKKTKKKKRKEEIVLIQLLLSLGLVWKKARTERRLF